MVNLIIGDLAPIDIGSLEFWFPVVAQENKLPGVKLNIIRQPGIALCIECKCRFEIHDLLENCPNCSSFKKSIVEGNELFIQNLEIN